MYEPINEKVGAWLLIPGNTQDALAERIGISRQSLAKRLQGSAEWKWQEVLALSDVLGVSLADLEGKED